MIFHKICPLCQEVCNNIFTEEDGSGSMGFCNSHSSSNFKYSFSTSVTSNSVVVELFVDNYYVLVEKNKADSKVFFRDNEVKNKQVILNEVPPFLNWNDFNLDYLVEKLNKLFAMQTFS